MYVIIVSPKIIESIISHIRVKGQHASKDPAAAEIQMKNTKGTKQTQQQQDQKYESFFITKIKMNWYRV